MKSKLKLENLLEKYIIVVDKKEERVVYDIDDSRIFSVKITGCGRGARNAVLTKNTFFTSLKKAEKGLTYLNSCGWGCPFKIIKVSDLKELSEKGYNYLLEDIDDYNLDIDFMREIEKESKKEIDTQYKNLLDRAYNLVNCNIVMDVVEEEKCYVIYLAK